LTTVRKLLLVLPVCILFNNVHILSYFVLRVGVYTLSVAF